MLAPTLAEAVAQYGRDAYLLTVANDGPHTSFVSVDLKGNVIACAIGKSAARKHCNRAQRIAVLAPKGAGRLCSRRQWHSHWTARAERRDQSGDHTDQVSPSSPWTEASRQRRAVPVRLPPHRSTGITTRGDRGFPNTKTRAGGRSSSLHAASPTPSKGRLIRCTVPGSTPNRFAILRTPSVRPGAFKVLSTAVRVDFATNIAYGIYDFSILLISTVSSLVSFAIAQWGLSRSFTLPDTNIVLPGFLYSCMLGGHPLRYNTKPEAAQARSS